MLSLPVTYSVTCTNALLNDIIPLFQIGNVTHCEFWCQGLNDSYKVTTTTDTFLLRIYRQGWRDLAAIKFELDALLHLQKNGVDIAYPIPTEQGEHVVLLEAPEGLRYAILTTYIKGNELDFSLPESAHLYAKHMSQIHLFSETFTSPHKRFKLDVKHLITEPLQRIKPFLNKRQDDWLFISEYAQWLAKQLQNALNNSNDLGLCHADLNRGNAHINEGKVASFDFDCCGFGLRVYDLAVVKWGLTLGKTDPEIWLYFLASYQQYRPLFEEDIALIDTLVSIRHIWLIGLHIDIAVAKGWLNEAYFDQNISFLREQAKLNEYCD